MEVLTIVRVVAVVCTGLLAGIFLGHRAGTYYALKEISVSSFVQFQQVVHVHFVRFCDRKGLKRESNCCLKLYCIR